MTDKQQSGAIFTESEVKQLAKYMNFVNTNAEFTLKAPAMQEFIQLTSGCIKLMKKCEAAIFEIRDTSPSPSEIVGPNKREASS